MLHYLLSLVSIATMFSSVRAPEPGRLVSDLEQSYRSINRHDSIDKKDLSYLFRQLAITRVRCRLQTEEEEYVLNPVIEEYREGRLVSSKSVIDTLTARIPGYTSDKARLVMKAMLSHLVVGDVERELRIYARQDQPNEAAVTLSVDEQPMTFTFPVDTATAGHGGAHPFAYSGMVPGTRVPLLSVYYVSKGEDFVDCPANADVETIAAAYHYVVIIYGEARTLR